jgi:4-amino-4-deoxy-L-arabinose transferase-like glycosyltransferase
MKLKKFDVIIFAMICALTIMYALHGLFYEAESILLVKIISLVPLSLLCVAMIKESFKRFKESFLSSYNGSIASAFLALGLGAMTLLPLRVSFREFFISKPLHEQLLTLFVFSFLYSVFFTFFIYPFISQYYAELKKTFLQGKKRNEGQDLNT